jgi:hypothetical protein
MVIGYAHAAGTANGVRCDLAEIADYFHVLPDRLERAVAVIESSDRPEVLLLQNPDGAAKVSAATIFSSAWSKSYEKFGNPYGKTHRDFHYQVMFCAMAALAEVGCNKLRIDHPMHGNPWSRDAYVCLLEATSNLRRHLNSKVAVFLQEGTYDSRMPQTVDAYMASFDMQDHRPVGISPHMFEGINMRTVFVERARDAMRTASGLAPTEGAG